MSHPREGEVLLELFAVTLGGSKELHSALVDCVLSLTAAAAKWQDAGVLTRGVPEVGAATEQGLWGI